MGRDGVVTLKYMEYPSDTLSIDDGEIAVYNRLHNFTDNHSEIESNRCGAGTAAQLGLYAVPII
jgi:hypothetical protein